ncbi:MAG: HIT family protein [bacterium]|nr:MAG: HIT family protein [bacterium]
MTSLHCPFCNIPAERKISETEYSVTLRDGHPVSRGHTLVVPRRHVESIFECTVHEKAHILQALEDARQALDREFSPDGYNIGINDGEAAGQTVPHLHVHLIPRYKGDASDPRGGVRWIFPERAKYWERE